MVKFPPAPDWAWDARIAVFPTEPGIDEYLALPRGELDRRARHYADRGVSFVNATQAFHARFDWVDRFDDIAEATRRIVEACHAAGMRVFEHHSSNLVLKGGHTAYGGWTPRDALAVDIRSGVATGQYGRRNESFLCINNAGYKAAYDRYVTDFVSRTGVDGLMHDDIHYAGQYYCACPDCRRSFEELFGYALPEAGRFPLDDYADPVWRDWIRFRLQVTGRRLCEVRRLLPDGFVLFACMTGAVLTDGDVHHAGASLETFCRGANAIFSEGGNLSFRNRGQTRPRNFYANWEKLFVEKKYVQGISHSFRHPAFDMHYPADPAEGYFCWALTKIFGHGLWRCDTNLYGGHNYDDEFEEWEPEFDYLNWERANAGLFRFPVNAADTGLVYSQTTKINLGDDPQHHGEAWAGWLQSLTAAGLAADGVPERDLEDPAALSRFRLLILPNAACLNAAALEGVRRFVAGGGRLIATHKTSLHDAGGGRLGDFALGDLFGCRFRSLRAEERISWFPDRRFAGETAFRGVPLRMSSFPGLMVDGGPETPDVRFLAWSEKTPLYHDQPQSPAIVRSRVGAGEVVYTAFEPGRMAYRQGFFPVWAVQYHRQRLMEKDDQGRPLIWWIAPPDRNPCKWIFTDEGHPAYRTLIANLVESLLPEPRLRVRVPDAVLFNAYALAARPDDRTGRGDLVVGFVNATGARFRHGEEIDPPVRIEYPRLEGSAEIFLRDPAVRGARFHSPDIPGPLELDVARAGDGVRVRFDLALLRCVGFVRILR